MEVMKKAGYRSIGEFLCVLFKMSSFLKVTCYCLVGFFIRRLLFLSCGKDITVSVEEKCWMGMGYVAA